MRRAQQRSDPSSSPLGEDGSGKGAAAPGVEEPESSHAAPHWIWAWLLKRVFALAMATCPFCHQKMLQIGTAITQTKIIRHLKRAADPLPMRHGSVSLVMPRTGYPPGRL